MAEQMTIGTAGVSPALPQGKARNPYAQEASQPASNKQYVAESLTASETPALKKDSSQVEEKSISEKQQESLTRAFEGLNQVMNHFSKSIKFDVFDKSGDLYAEVVNMETNEVIKTIPSKEAMEMMTRVNDVLGMLVDEST